MSELALGTVQFGLNYGITNLNGEVSDQELASILNFAATQQINLFDTAADYGDAQNRLGNFSSPSLKPRYISKFSLPNNSNLPTVENVYGNSIQELGVNHLEGLLFHKITDLQDRRTPEVLKIMKDAREEGKIENIGVSIYSLQELEIALGVFPDLDIVQLPSNILDLKLLNSALVQQLVGQGVQIHVRSVFLQGLLLSDPEQIPTQFSPLKPALAQLQKLSRELGQSIIELILGNMKFHPHVSAVVIGSTSVSELAEITEAWEKSINLPEIALPEVSEEILDPRKWPKLGRNL